MAALRSEWTSSLLSVLLVAFVSEWTMMTARSEIPSSKDALKSKDLVLNGSTKTLQGLRATRDLSPANRKDGAGGINGSAEVKDIWLLGLFPLKGSWPGGLGQLPAVKLGIQHVNDDPNILPGYRLQMTVDDTECDPGLGMNALFRQIYMPPAKVLVLGAGCSGVSQATAQVSHLWNLVQLSYSSASPALSSKDKYKRFFRVFPPESSFNPAKFDLLDYYGWKKVGTIYDGGELFSLTTTDFIRKASERGIKIITAESFVGDPRQQVRNLKKHGARIIVGNFYENKAQVVFCEAYKQQMYGPMYAWIITGFFTPEWWRKKPDNENQHDCTPEQLEEAVQGYFTADALPFSLSEKPGISGKTHVEVMAEYKNITNNTSPSGHQEAPYGYDSVWTVALMLNNSLRLMTEQSWGRKIEHFTYKDLEMSELFLNVTISTNFEGVSGPVMFDENGDRKGLTQIEQLQGNKEVKVGVYDPSLRQINKIIWDEQQLVIWPDDGVPPRDSLSEKISPRVISAGLFVLMTVLASIGIVLSCFFLVFNIRYRHRKYIKMSSPNMNNFILVGAILAFSSIIFGGTGSVLVNSFILLAMCKFYNWTLALGFSLAFGAMFSKTWRVHKIFTNKKIQRMVIKDYQLMALVCALVLFDVLVLTVWEFVNPLAIITYNTSTELTSGPVNDNQMILVLQSRYCESTHMWYFAGVLYAVKGLLLLFGAFLAFETRKVTVPALNDSKFIGISVYNVVVLCLIGVPTAIMIKDQLDAAYTLISLFTFFATALTICLVFIPKALKRNREPHTGTMWMKATESTIVTQRKTCGIQLTTSIGGGGGSVGAVGGGAGVAGGGGALGVERGNGGSSTVTERLELDRLIEENITLRQALEECQRRLIDRQDLLPFTDLSSPQTQSEDFPATANIYPSSSMPSLGTDKIYSI